MNLLLHSIKQHNRIIITLAMVALFMFSGLLLAYLLRDMDWELMRQTSLKVWFAILLLTLLVTFTYTLLVYLLIRSSGYTATLWKTYLVLAASLSANYITPVKVGVPFRIYLYYHFMGIPIALGTALMTIELLIGILLPALMAIVGSTVIFPSLGLITPMILTSLLLVILLLALRVPSETFQIYLERLPFSSFTLRLARFFQDVQFALQQVSLATILSVVFLLSLMIGGQIVRLWLILSIFGSPPSLFALLAVFTISVTAGSFSMVPMGLGVREASFTLLLAQLGVLGKIALSIAVIERLFSSGISLVMGMIAINILGVSELVKSRGDISMNQKTIY